jgi:predicted nuclease of predicted toxin-antitoxin system
MKFKLDENFGTRAQKLFSDSGHDVQTVHNEGLQGCIDNHLFEVCCAEQRCLITLDMDFADVMRFPPDKSGGIVVIRAPKNPSILLLEQMITQFLQSLLQMSVKGRLWIVEIGRIRIHHSETEKDL